MRLIIWRNLSRLARTEYLDEISFKVFFIKNAFLMTCKNYPVPAKRDLLHNLDLTFTSKESRLPERSFFFM